MNPDRTPNTSKVVKVAKPYKLWCSIASATFPNGDVWSYDYAPYLPGGARYSANKYEYVRRDATLAGVTGVLRQIIVPWYLNGDSNPPDIILADKLTEPLLIFGDDGTQFTVDFMENGPRHWTTKADQST